MVVPFYTKEQPEDGDVICHCEHAFDDDSGQKQAFRLPSNAKLETEDGMAKWIIICNNCFAETKCNALKIAEKLTGHFVINGNEPIFLVPPSQN